MIRLATKQEINSLNQSINYIIGENVFEKCFVYLIDDNVLGFIDFSDIYERLELNFIWINPAMRGNGYAKELMNFMIDYCVYYKKDNITLEVATDNLVARNLYFQYGFSKIATRQQYYNGTDAVLMIRKFGINE